MFCSECKGCWGPQQCLQVQWLATRAGTCGGKHGSCAHTQLWGPAAGTCVVVGLTADIHIVVGASAYSKGGGQPWA